MGIAVIAVAITGYVLATRDRSSNGDAVLAAARQYAVDLTTYDFATVDEDFARFARHGTKAFRASYAATMATTKPAIVKAQSRALGTVVGAGVESSHNGRATVLLVVDQEVRSARQTGAVVNHSRIRMTLVHVGDGWLVSAVTVL